MVTDRDALVMEPPKLFGDHARLLTLATMPSVHWSPGWNPQRREGRESLQGRTILVVDDEVLVVNVGQHILEDAGYQVLTAASGEAGLEVYRQRRDDIDLVILDYVMPGINGFQTWQKLVELDPEVRVLFWSGYLADKEVARLIAQSGCEFIGKPYQISELLSKVRRLLERDS